MNLIKQISMIEIETTEQLIHAMQSSQFSMDEKKAMLVEFFTPKTNVLEFSRIKEGKTKSNIKIIGQKNRTAPPPPMWVWAMPPRRWSGWASSPILCSCISTFPAIP